MSELFLVQLCKFGHKLFGAHLVEGNGQKHIVTHGDGFYYHALSEGLVFYAVSGRKIGSSGGSAFEFISEALASFAVLPIG